MEHIPTNRSHNRSTLIAILYKLISIPNRKVISFAVNTFLILLFISSLSLNLYGYYEKGRNMSNIPYQVFFLDPSDALMHIN